MSTRQRNYFSFFQKILKMNTSKNSIEREIYSYVEQAERMSGYDSYDSFEGDMDYFGDDMDDDMDGFDGDAFSYAGGNAANIPVSDPYVIQYTNTTAGNLQAVLFGFNDFFGAGPQFGNPVGITITALQGGTYGRLMAQSNNKFFKIGKWRFQSTTPAQLQQTLNLVHYDANGKQYSTPLNLSVMRDAYQFQSDIIDVTRPVTIDGNSQVNFTLIANATLVISIYPIAVMSGKAQLNGGHMLNTARAPRLSGKNVAPVIIQTSQDVKGITKG